MNSFFDGSGNNIVVESEMNASVTDFWTDAFSTCICIGDSVTEGVTVGAGSCTEPYPYPTRLAKMTGWTIKNAGAAGLTTLQWWQNRFSQYDYTQYQVALIELGYNSGLTDTLDTDCVGDSYTAYADTNTGGYCKIIEGALAQNPNLYIVPIISPGFNESVANVVIKIAEKYGLPVIDLRDITYIKLQDAKYHTKADGTVSDYTHLTAMGYLAKAKLVHLYLGEILAKDTVRLNAVVTA